MKRKRNKVARLIKKKRISIKQGKRRIPFRPGVSIITCTNNSVFIDNIYRNYSSQIWNIKELILILNHDDLKIDDYLVRAAAYPNIRVFQLPQSTSLGLCLNFAVTQAKYSYVAKFDHDDYYGPYYLQEMMRVFRTKKVHVVGKRSYYTYLEGDNLLINRFPNRENHYVRYVHGATFVIKKSILKRIPFADVPIDDDGIFLRSCRGKGLRIFSANKSHYIYIRRQNQNDHGWKVETDYLLKQAKNIGRFNELEEIIHFVTMGRAGIDDFNSLKRELNLFNR